MIYNYIEIETQQLLNRFDLYKVGVDLKRLLKKLDIQLVEKDFDEDVSGLFVMNGEQKIISVNKTENSNRQRFTIAHEIGHYILHSKNQPIFIDRMPRVMYRNSVSSTGENLREREANAFAASLLMPKELVETEIQNMENELVSEPIRYLSKKFIVSEQAIAIRLSNLGYDLSLM